MYHNFALLVDLDAVDSTAGNEHGLDGACHVRLPECLRSLRHIESIATQSEDLRLIDNLFVLK